MTDADFLAAIATRPGDDLTRLVYADWLDEQGDPRAEYVRLVVAVAAEPTRTERTPRLHELAAAIDAGWRAGVGVRYDVLLAVWPGEYKITTIKAVRNATGLGLADAKAIVESRLPAPLARAVLREEAECVLGSFAEGFTQVWPLTPPMPGAMDCLAFRRAA